ncbi:MAG TPA: DUF5658 family protein [Methylomirabilota bacterium]|nr:DUF5658 family protein [Methylomirabilota bacterium]
MLSRYLIWGRRRGGRRAGEQSQIYVDRPAPWALTACVLLVALSIADAHVTLRILSAGGAEINPVMRAALALGDHSFVFLKVGLTVVGAVILYLHTTWLLGRVCLWIAVGGYAFLTAYHLVVLAVRGWS